MTAHLNAQLLCCCSGVRKGGAPLQKRIRFTLSVLDGADVLQGDLDATVGSAEELDEIGVLAVLGRERDVDARVGADLVALRHALGHVLLHDHALGQRSSQAPARSASAAARLEHLLAQVPRGKLVGLVGVLGHVGLRARSATAVLAPNSSATSSTTVVTASNTSRLEASMEHCRRPSG